MAEDERNRDGLAIEADKATSYGAVDVDAETGQLQPAEGERTQPTEVGQDRGVAADADAVAAVGTSGATAAERRDWAASGCSFVLALAWVKAVSALVVFGVLSKSLSRKVVHITSGPFFVLTWPIYSDSQQARYVAALTPAVQALKLIAVGTGFLADEATVRAVSRVGDRLDVLRGPFYYVLVLLGCTLFFWRRSAVGIVTISIMCAGDGLAEIFGRQFGTSNPWPWNHSKSAAGSCAMLLGGSVLAASFLAVFKSLELIDIEWKRMGPVLIMIVVVCTLFESLPATYIDDNLSVPIIAAVLSARFLGRGS